MNCSNCFHAIVCRNSDYLSDNIPADCTNYIDSNKVYESLPKGKWVVEGKTTLHYSCSECGSAGDQWDKFCKNCGAVMQKPEVE